MMALAQNLSNSINLGQICVILGCLGGAVRFTTKDAVKYAVLPGVLPRVSSLFFTGFGSVTYLVALVCLAARLLPRSHPIFNTKLKHEYSVARILFEAGQKVQFKWQNIDQILLYIAVLSAVILMAGYVASLVIYVLISTASAADFFPSMFQTENPEYDAALMMLDRVFGVPGLYNTVVSFDEATYGPFPNPFQLALQGLFNFFNMALFLIAVFIFLFFVVEIVFEVTQTGRFLDHISDGQDGDHSFGWLPLRFILAFGLLIPISDGFNSAQWITLYTAKYGSGMATNAWITFNYYTGENPAAEDNEHLVSLPRNPDLTGLIKSLMMVKSCYNTHAMARAYSGDQQGKDVGAYVVSGSSKKSILEKSGSGVNHPPYFYQEPKDYAATPSGVADGTAGDTFIDILKFANMKDIRIVFGEFKEDRPTFYEEYPGGVLPVCGEVVIPVSGYTGEAMFAAEGYLYSVLYIILNTSRNGQPDLDHMERNAFLAFVREFNRNSALRKSFMNDRIGGGFWTGNPECLYDADNDGYESATTETGDYLGKCTLAVPSKYYDDLLNDYYSYSFRAATYAAYHFLSGTPIADLAEEGGPHLIGETSYSTLGKPNPMGMNASIIQYGWGGAGMWYDRISERNGSLYSAVKSIPSVTRMPMTMESIKVARAKNDPGAGESFCDQYNPRKSGVTELTGQNEKNQFQAEEAEALYTLCTQLHENENVALAEDTAIRNTSTNPLIAGMQAVFSQIKLFDIHQNDTVLPMVQLSTIGRLLIDNAIFNMLVSTGMSAGGGLAHVLGGKGVAGMNQIGMMGGHLAEAFISFAVIGLTAGVTLHYVLPLLPFMYFFFAVGRWVKTIFEAMVGVPLWAFAHMRTGGAGLPGNAASSGYFLLLEIFIRPTITVFALVASFGAFSALVVGLNSVFELITTNLLGAVPDPADPDKMQSIRMMADQFFYSIMYIVIVYMIGMGCFKLIDIIPDNIMRWSGAGIQSFGTSDNADDLVDKLEYQLPVLVSSEAKQFGGLIKGTFYEPLKKYGSVAEAELAAKMQKEAIDKANNKQSSYVPPEALDNQKAPVEDRTRQDMAARMAEQQAAARQAQQQAQQQAERDRLAREKQNTPPPKPPTNPTGGKK